MTKEHRDITLKVGGQVTLRSGFATKIILHYGGMPDRETYSLIVSNTSGYNSQAYNLFFPSSRRSLEVGKRRLEILSVTPDEICLHILNIRKI
jgi:hypothetical protein